MNFLVILIVFLITHHNDISGTNTQPKSTTFIERAGLLLKTNFNNFSATGTIAPTSLSTINEILKPLRARNKNKPIHILEVGFGEGCITREIIKELGAQDSYCGVELDENLFKPVAEECKGEKRKFICGPIEECSFPKNQQFDFIISTIPLSTVPTEPVKKILTREHELLKPQGTISYIAYWFSFKIMGAFNFFKGTESSKSYDEKMDFLTKWRNQFTWTEANVVLNLPPVCVYHGLKTL